MAENYLELKEQRLYYSSKIQCEPKNPSDVLSITINYPTENMQTDSSDFEGIAVAAWSVEPSLTIRLKYEQFNKDEDGNNWDRKSLQLPSYKDAKGSDRVRSAWLHYMRFLYRVMTFQNQYGKDKFVVDDSNNDEIELFRELYTKALESKNLYITRPTEEGKAKTKDEIVSQKTVLENHLEKWFVKNSECLTGELEKEFIEKVGACIKVYDQLPCSMFYKCPNDKPSAASRIFTAGYFDLWGVKDNELCLFELKKEDNAHLGIISELYFYANLMKDMKETKDVYKRVKNNHTFKYRGFDVFWNNEKNGKVNAYFLVPELYPFFESNKKAILEVLNKGNTGIKFDVIMFDQKFIVGDYDDFIEGIK